MCPPWLGCCVRLAELVSCLRICLPMCLPPGSVFHLGWGAVSASLGLSPVLSPNLSPIWLCLPVLSPHLFPIWLCLSPWLGCCVRLAGVVSQFVSKFVCHLALSPSFVSPFVPIWLCLSPWLGCCVRLAGLVSGFVSQCVSHLALSQFCLPICSPSGFVFHLGWGAVSASLGLSPNLSPIWLCLSPWLGCCVRLARLVSQFVSHLAFTLAGVLCPPRWACLPICLPSHLAFLRSCLRICLPSGFVS